MAVTVTGGTLTSIAVTPTTVSLAVGNTRQLDARGTHSDGGTIFLTNTATWSSDDTAIATVAPGGELTAVAVGSANVTASQGSITANNSVAVTVTVTVTSIAVTPTTVSLAVGNTQQPARKK